jgi:hypothetical protein
VNHQRQMLKVAHLEISIVFGEQFGGGDLRIHRLLDIRLELPLEVLEERCSAGKNDVLAQKRTEWKV